MIELIGLKELALGGIVAAVIGAWSHVKGWLHQISSLVVIQAQLDYNIDRRVSLHLRRHWKLLPSGISVFYSQWMTHGGRESKLTPFKIPGTTSIYYRNRNILFYKSGANGGHGLLYSVRGFINFQTLIKDSILEQDEITRNLESKVSRYQVKEVYGTAAERMFGIDNPRHDRTSLQESGAPGHIELDTTMDKSFMYASELFNQQTTDDPFEHMFYSPEQMKYVEEAQRWMKMREWYEERSIPWRRGWLIHGPGGTGKTDFSKTVAKALKIPIVNMILSSMTDKEFIEEWRSLPTPCVVLFDDLDTVFNKRENITNHKSLTFDTILGQLSGVNSFNGVFLFITTNHLDKIDEALGIAVNENGLSTRPGRIDRVIHMGAATEDVRQRVIEQILRDWSFMWEFVLNDTKGLTVAQTQEVCRQAAFEEMEKREKDPHHHASFIMNMQTGIINHEDLHHQSPQRASSTISRRCF